MKVNENIASFSPFLITKGLHKNSVPHTSRYLAASEQQSILRHGVKTYGMMYWSVIKKFHQLSSLIV